MLRTVRTLGGLALLLTALSWLAPPGPAVAAVTELRDAEAALVGMAGVAAWVAAGWLVLATGLVAGQRLPGALGAVARFGSRVAVPATARRLLTIALGATLLTGAGAGTALAAPTPPTVATVSQLDLDWPVGPPGTPSAGVPTSAAPAPPSASPTQPPSPGPTTTPSGTPRASQGPPTSRPVPTRAPSDRPTATPSDRPTTTPKASARGTTPDGATKPADRRQKVVVRPGDTLWSIAARQLGDRATDADIAREWPRWWAANRLTIGADPDLIRPGQQLVTPDPSR